MFREKPCKFRARYNCAIVLRNLGARGRESAFRGLSDKAESRYATELADLLPRDDNTSCEVAIVGKHLSSRRGDSLRLSRTARVSRVSFLRRVLHCEVHENFFAA